MKDLGKIVAHIPARGGSKRVKAKNLRLLCGKPMLQYSIDSAINANVFDSVYVNSDNDDMLALAESLGAVGYKREAYLADDTATGDQFTADFITKVQPDTLVMISPVCPLVTGKEISQAIDLYRQSDCDTLITCESTQMQTFCEDEPVNIDLTTQLAPTQENKVVRILNWAVTIWDAKLFMKNYEQTGSAYIGKVRQLMPIDPMKGIKISHEEDFKMVERIMAGITEANDTDSEPEYWTQDNS